MLRAVQQRHDKAALSAYFNGVFGDPIDVASGRQEIFLPEVRAGERFAGLLDKAQQLLDDERFFNWQVAFPGVWSEWEGAGLTGGFDAVIGNPPWDRMKLQQVEWFATRYGVVARPGANRGPPCAGRRVTRRSTYRASRARSSC